MRTRYPKREATEHVQWMREFERQIVAWCPRWRLSSQDWDNGAWHYLQGCSANDAAFKLVSWHKLRPKYCRPFDLRSGDKVCVSFGIVTIDTIVFDRGMQSFTLTFREDQPAITASSSNDVQLIGGIVACDDEGGAS